MTSLSLTLWIAVGIALQLAIYLGISFWRHWQNFQGLRAVVMDANLPIVQAAEEADTAVPAWKGFRDFRVARREFEDEAQTVCSFYLTPGDSLPLPSFLPGQFLTFKIEPPTTDGTAEELVRCYSLSDAPSDKAYRVSIKRVPAPAGSAHPPGRSSGYFHEHVKVNQVLQVRAPAGHFHIDRGDSPVVLIGGGIGITPMLSMLNWSLREQKDREIWLFYGVRNAQELVMQQHLIALAADHPNFHLRLCFSDPLGDEIDGSATRLQSRVSVDLLRRQLPLRPYHFYICGPAPMMESLVPALDDWGVPTSRIHFEAFGPASIKRPQVVPAELAPADPAVGSAISDIVVNFARSGKSLNWSPSSGSLLEFAESNGVSVNSGCRAGGCGSCQTTIQQGEVAYRQAPDFDPEPGSCLLCVCTPKTSVTLEA